MCVCGRVGYVMIVVDQVLEPAFRSPYVNVNRWFLTCVNQPQFKAVLGEVEICTKMASFDGKQIYGLVQSGSVKHFVVQS